MFNHMDQTKPPAEEMFSTFLTHLPAAVRALHDCPRGGAFLTVFAFLVVVGFAVSAAKAKAFGRR